MPSNKLKTEKQPKLSTPREVELKITSYPYPCALCGKGSVGWRITGKTMLNPANNTFVQLPLKHDVCGQEITLDVKLEELQ